MQTLGEKLEYQKYDFCKSKNCWRFFENKCLDIGCQYTAKEFHQWLQKNGFILLRKEIPNRNIPYIFHKN